MNKFGNGRVKLAIAVIFLLAFLYVATYVSMSVKGRYEPSSIGLDHVKAWSWTPAGFTRANGMWNPTMIRVFAPLYVLDTRYWHRHK